MALDSLFGDTELVQLLAPLPGEPGLAGLAGLWALTGLAGLSGLSGLSAAGAGTGAGACVTGESTEAGLWALTGLAGDAGLFTEAGLWALAGLAGEAGLSTETGLSTEFTSATGGATVPTEEPDVVEAGVRGDTFTDAAEASDVAVGGITTGADNRGTLFGASCSST